MQNTQGYSLWKPQKDPYAVTDKPTSSSSVIQLRGNVIVSPSQLTSTTGGGDNNHVHYTQETPSRKGDDGGGERDEFLQYKIPNDNPNCGNDYYHHMTSYNNNDGSNYPDHYYNSSCESELPDSTVPQLNEKTDQNGDSQKRGKARTKIIVQSFTCQYCQKIFKHKSYFDYHLRTHTGERPYKCTLCDKSFFERSKLNRHLSSCHNIKNNGYDPSEDVNDKVISCPKCPKTFPRSSGLLEHIRSHHEGSRPFKCTKCEKKFSGLTALKNHEKSHQGMKSILCDICGKAFLLKKYLDLHLNTTHKREPRKHRCPLCRKDFHSEKDLKRHQLMHSNAKNFTCSLCQTSFKRKDNLNRHLKLTHSLTSEQINEESGNLETHETINIAHSNSDALDVVNHQEPASLPPPVPPINQVSVIKSTHEVMMSITRGRQFI